jgi:hypothetical protein
MLDDLLGGLLEVIGLTVADVAANAVVDAVTGTAKGVAETAAVIAVPPPLEPMQPPPARPQDHEE